MNQQTKNVHKTIYNSFNLSEFGTPIERVEKAIAALKNGNGVLVLDDEDR